MSKYKLGLDRSIYIECLKCEKRSFSPGDIKNLYCPTCGFFFEPNKIYETKQSNKPTIKGE